MADFWIRDEAGRVLGPIGLPVLRDLIAAGRLARIQSASRDGGTFVPVAQVPEVADLVAREARRADDKVEAERIGGLLHVLQQKPPHEVFELPADATLDQFKTAFFRLAKHFHPDRLPADAAPELRLAYDSIFHFLASTMAGVESRLGSGTPVAGSPAARSASPAAAGSPAKPSTVARGFGADAFVGLVQRPDGQPEIEVNVTPANIGIFVENDLVNLQKDGVFIPMQQGVPLGSTLDLRFEFSDPKKTVRARGRVVFENFGGRRGRPGIGLKFVRLDDTDRAFIADFVRRWLDDTKNKKR